MFKNDETTNLHKLLNIEKKTQDVDKLIDENQFNNSIFFN
jgi:hypothetical protein